MKNISIAAVILIVAVLSACGSTLEFFPDVNDTFAPTITASIASNSAPNASTTLFNNRSTHVPSLPATVTFISDEAATIYFTTNGSTPTTASSSVTAGKNISVSGPSITVTSTILKFFGIDTLSNSSTIQTSTIVSP